MKTVLGLVGGLSLVLLTGCAVEGGYGGGYAGVYGEYPSGYYGSAFYPGYANPYYYHHHHYPYDRDHYWDRNHYWDRSHYYHQQGHHEDREHH